MFDVIWYVDRVLRNSELNDWFDFFKHFGRIEGRINLINIIKFKRLLATICLGHGSLHDDKLTNGTSAHQDVRYCHIHSIANRILPKQCAIASESVFICVKFPSWNQCKLCIQVILQNGWCYNICRNWKVFCN